MRIATLTIGVAARYQCPVHGTAIRATLDRQERQER